MGRTQEGTANNPRMGSSEEICQGRVILGFGGFELCKWNGHNSRFRLQTSLMIRGYLMLASASTSYPLASMMFKKYWQLYVFKGIQILKRNPTMYLFGWFPLLF